MRLLRSFLWGDLFLLCKAQRFPMDETPEGRQRCLEIYGAESWRNALSMRSYQPRISISAARLKEVESDPIVSVVIFHKNDGDLGGLELNGKKKYVCDEDAITNGLCRLDEYGAFIGRHDEAKFPIFSTAIHVSRHSQPIVFTIEHTGIYCIEAIGFTARKFQLLAHFELGYGQIPAIQLPRLEFSAFLTLISAVAAIISTAHRYFVRESKCNPLSSFNFLAWVFTFQSMMLWTHLIYVNEHSYDYQDPLLRVFVIFLVALRDSLTVVHCYRALSVLPAPQVQAKLGNFNCLAIFVLASLLFFCAAARENEMLQGPNNTRDTFALIWTLFVAVILLLYHGLLIGSLRGAVLWQQQYPKSQELVKTKSLIYALSAITLTILSFATADLLLLISWIRADEYGRDLLTKTWRYRWFLVNEWHTFILLADITAIVCHTQSWLS